MCVMVMIILRVGIMFMVIVMVIVMIMVIVTIIVSINKVILNFLIACISVRVIIKYK